MKRRLLVLALLLQVVTAIQLAAQSVNKGGPSEGQIVAWRSAKTIKIRVTQKSPPDQSLPQLPFDDVVGRLIAGAGLRLVGNDALADLTLAIKSYGEALGAYYWTSGQAPVRTYRYTGASISGTIELEVPDLPVYQRAFAYTLNPTTTTVGRDAAGDAPLWAALVGPSSAISAESKEQAHAFLPELLRLVYRAWGVGPLLAALASFETLPNAPWVSSVGAVVSLLGEVKDTRAVEALLPLARYQARNFLDPGLRLNLMWALGEIGDVRAIGTLLDHIGTGENEGFAAAEALAKIPGTAAVPRLIELLEKNPTDYEANCIAATLGKLGGPAAFDVLSRVYKLVPGQGGIEGLGWTRDARAVDLLVGMLAPEQPIQKKEAAIKALVRLGDARAVNPLIGVLLGQDVTAVPAAVYALTAINDPRAIGPLVQRLQESTSLVYDAIIVVLVKMTGVHAIDKKGRHWGAKQWWDWWEKESKRKK